MNYGLGSRFDLAGCVADVSLGDNVVSIENAARLVGRSFSWQLSHSLRVLQSCEQPSAADRERPTPRISGAFYLSSTLSPRLAAGIPTNPNHLAQPRLATKGLPCTAKITYTFARCPGEEVIFGLLSLSQFCEQRTAFFGKRDGMAFVVLTGIKSDRVIEQVHLLAAHWRLFCFSVSEQFSLSETVGVGPCQKPAKPQLRWPQFRCYFLELAVLRFFDESPALVPLFAHNEAVEFRHAGNLPRLCIKGRVRRRGAAKPVPY